MSTDVSEKGLESMIVRFHAARKLDYVSQFG